MAEHSGSMAAGGPGDGIHRSAGCQRDDGGRPGQASARPSGPPQEHDVDDTAPKIRDARRDCEPETEMFQKGEDKFKSSNIRDNWKNTSQGRSGQVYKENNSSRTSSPSNTEVSNNFEAMALITPLQMERTAIPGQHNAPPTSQHTRHATSQTGNSMSSAQQNTQQSQQTQGPQQTQSQPQSLPQPQPQPQTQSQSQPQPQLQPQLQGVFQRQRVRQCQSQPQSEPRSQAESQTGSQQTRSEQPPAVVSPGDDVAPGKENKDSNEDQRDPPKTESKSSEISTSKKEKPEAEVRNEEERKETGTVQPCTTSVTFLLDHSTDPNVTQKQERIIYELSPDYSHSSTLKNVHGLALSLSKLEDWRIRKLLEPHIPSKDIRDTGVRNILKELATERRTIGDIVQYFTQYYSKRLDIVDHILEIHKGCPYCDRIRDSG